eukprot:6774722-Prorocentrum_lima.AAC.1
MDFYNHQVATMTRKYQEASQVLGYYYQGPPGLSSGILRIGDSSNKEGSSCASEKPGSPGT